MKKVTILRGMPGTGKSTWARINTNNDTIRLNRDDFRTQFFGKKGILPFEQEEFISKIEHDAAESALARDMSVIVDATNLRARYVRAWMETAHRCGAEYEVIDFEADLDELIRRDKLRPVVDRVGETTLRTLWQKFMTQNKGDLPDLPEAPSGAVSEPVEWKLGLPRAIICDLDGTLARRTEGGRGPYEFDRVGEDEIVEAVESAVVMADFIGLKVIFLSGRSEECREQTQAWLDSYMFHDHPLFMRAAGDKRRDSVVKRELFDKHIRGKYNINFVLDDRDSVVRMWREELGLPCFQVAPGAF